MTKPRVVLEIGILPLVLIAFVLFLSVATGHCEKKPLHIPVTIHVEHTEKDEVYFTPVVMPMFEGYIRGVEKDFSKEKIQSCYATSEPVATTSGGAEVENLVLVCGETKIYLETVDFR